MPQHDVGTELCYGGCKPGCAGETAHNLNCRAALEQPMKAHCGCGSVSYDQHARYPLWLCEFPGHIADIQGNRQAISSTHIDALHARPIA
ncbi:MAG TPA: hypothetical protein VKB58_02070 [Terriglobales bacterium]|nr:hypothetical protein [Terriglobales bacterium]